MSEQFFDAGGGLELALYTWRPAGPARAVLVAIHGFKSYGALFEGAAQQLAQSGIAVYAHDHRGHGRSDGVRLWAESIDDYVGDVAKLVELARAREPGLPVFLLGHSAGGVIGCTYVLDHAETLAGFICESFAFEVPVPGFVLDLVKLISHLAPRAGVLELKDEHFSRDPRFVERMKTDPLISRAKYPAITVAALARADDRLRREFQRIQLPLLILHGSADKATRPQGSELFYRNAGSSDKTLHIYEGHAHDLLNDVGNDLVLADIRTWIDERVTARAGAIAETPVLRPRPIS